MWDECGSYTAVYGVHVIDIEYPDDLAVPFQQACLDNPDVPSMVLRDRDLTAPGNPDHVFALCEGLGLFADGFEPLP